MAKTMSREEIENGRDEYRRKMRENMGPMYDGINWNALPPDPWTALLERLDDEIIH